MLLVQASEYCTCVPQNPQIHVSEATNVTYVSGYLLPAQIQRHVNVASRLFLLGGYPSPLDLFSTASSWQSGWRTGKISGVKVSRVSLFSRRITSCLFLPLHSTPASAGRKPLSMLHHMPCSSLRSRLEPVGFLLCRGRSLELSARRKEICAGHFKAAWHPYSRCADNTVPLYATNSFP